MYFWTCCSSSPPLFLLFLCLSAGLISSTCFPLFLSIDLLTLWPWPPLSSFHFMSPPVIMQRCLLCFQPPLLLVLNWVPFKQAVISVAFPLFLPVSPLLSDSMHISSPSVVTHINLYSIIVFQVFLITSNSLSIALSLCLSLSSSCQWWMDEATALGPWRGKGDTRTTHTYCP